jgi:hypothetical protein
LDIFNHMRLNLLAFAILFFGTHLNGQNVGIYPDQYSSVFFNPSLFNPAYISNSGSSESAIQSKLRRGLYQDITTISATLQKTFQTKGQNWHSARLSLFNEKEGPYISIPRFYGNYGLRIRLKEETSILAGILFGAVNPNFSTPTKSINTVLIDGALGFIFRHKETSIGISSYQIFDNFSSTNKSIKLKRFYSAHFDTRFGISQSVEISTHLLCTYYTDIPTQANASVSVIFQETITGGLGYKNRQGTFVYFSVTANKDSEHPIKILTLYNSLLFSNQNAMSESVELGFIYSY